jgi:hypothetical protein
MDDNAEEPIQAQRAEAQAGDTIMAALILRPREWTATTGGPSAFATLSHRQTSVVIRAVTVGLQASRVLRWQATIGDCCAGGMRLRKGATE